MTFAKLESWRSKNHLPRTKAVKLLGVTIGTWYNWARGRSVPTLSAQKRLAEVVKGRPATATPRPTRSAPAGRSRGAALVSVGAAASIVNAYIARSRGNLSTSEVLKFLEEVLATLADGQ